MPRHGTLDTTSRYKHSAPARHNQNIGITASGIKDLKKTVFAGQGYRAVLELEQRELDWLLEGLDVCQGKAHDQLRFPVIF